MNRQSFRIGIQAKLKHGLFMEGLECRGWNQAQGAQFLEISQQTFGRWINMKEVPKNLSAEIIIKLYELTGASPEEIWPEEVFTPEFLATPRLFKRVREIPKPLLGTFGIIRSFPSSPHDIAEKKELERAVHDALEALSQKERDVLIGRFFEEKSLEAIGIERGVGIEAIRRIESSALRNLRCISSHSKKLREYIENPEDIADLF